MFKRNLIAITLIIILGDTGCKTVHLNSYSDLYKNINNSYFAKNFKQNEFVFTHDFQLKNIKQNKKFLASIKSSKTNIKDFYKKYCFIQDMLNMQFCKEELFYKKFGKNYFPSVFNMNCDSIGPPSGNLMVCFFLREDGSEFYLMTFSRCNDKKCANKYYFGGYINKLVYCNYSIKKFVVLLPKKDMGLYTFDDLADEYSDVYKYIPYFDLKYYINKNRPFAIWQSPNK